MLIWIKYTGSALLNFLYPTNILKTRKGRKLPKNKKNDVANIAAESDVYGHVIGDTLTKG